MTGLKLAPDDREYNHIDIGERYFDFRLCINEEFVDASAEIFNRPPLVLAYFPSIGGKIEYDPVRIDNRHVIMSALKKFNGGTLIRLYNSSDKPQKCSVIIGKTEFACIAFSLRGENIYRIGRKDNRNGYALGATLRD